MIIILQVKIYLKYRDEEKPDEENANDNEEEEVEEETDVAK